MQWNLLNLKMPWKKLMISRQKATEFPLRLSMFFWRTSNEWVMQLIPAGYCASFGTLAQLEVSCEDACDPTGCCVFFCTIGPTAVPYEDACEDVFAWKIKKDWCVELIPAELKASAETVHKVKGYSNWVFLKENIVAWRTENIRCVELIPAELEVSVVTVETLVMAGFGRVCWGRPWTCGPRKVIHH